MVKILINCFFYTFYIDQCELNNYIIFDKVSKKYRTLNWDDYKDKIITLQLEVNKLNLNL